MVIQELINMNTYLINTGSNEYTIQRDEICLDPNGGKTSYLYLGDNIVAIIPKNWLIIKIK